MVKDKQVQGKVQGVQGKRIVQDLPQEKRKGYCNDFMKKTILILLMLIVNFSMAYSITECQVLMKDNEVPCYVLLPNNASKTQCSTINVSFYSNYSFVSSQLMYNYTPFLCNATFTHSSVGTYSFYFTTGDSGTITVEEEKNNVYYLYLTALIIFFILFGISYYLEDNTFIVLSGFLCLFLAFNLFVNGFPGLTSTFLRDAIIVVLAGIGVYIMIVPTIEYLETHF